MRHPITQPTSHRIEFWIAIAVFIFTLSGFTPLPASAQQVITTFSKGAPGDPFSSPTYLAFDKLGNLFVSDTGNVRVQRIDKQTGTVTTVAGTKVPGYSGDGGPATQAEFGCPGRLVFDDIGNLYINDQCQNVVRKIVPGADSTITGASDEIITSYAGNGTRSAPGVCILPDGVAASQTPVDIPSDIAIDHGGNLFIISTVCAFDLIRRVDAVSGLISTTVYQLGSRGGDNAMVFDNANDLFTRRSHSIQSCSPTSGQFLTGNEDCMGAVGGFFDPYPKAFDKAGNLFFLNLPCDPDAGCDFAIYKTTPGPTGIVGPGSTVSQYAGSGDIGYSGDGGPPLAATFMGPNGMAADDAGNLYIADVGNNVIRIVSSAPAPPTLTSHPANPTNQTTAVFTFVANGPATTFVCTLDQVTSPCSSGVTYPNLSDGSHTFSVVGQQTGGTASNPASFMWVVDTVPPPVPSIASHPSDPSGTGAASFTFSDAEAAARLTCSLDASLTFCTSPVVYAGLPDGTHSFSVIATDTAGNSSTANFTWAIHTTIPSTPNIDSAPPVLTNQNVSAFSFSDAQSGINLLCQLDTQEPALCTSPVTFLGLPDGAHSFSVIASDPASGRSSAPATYSWTVDTTPPFARLTGLLGRVVIPNPSTFSFGSRSTDVAGYLCSVDGAAFTTCAPPFSQSVTTPGSHTFSVEAVDFAGNIGPPDTETWEVTNCRCGLVGDYSNPAFNTNIFGQSSPGGEFTVSGIQDPNSHISSVSVIRASDGVAIYNFTIPSGFESTWQFSPDGTHFLYHILNPQTSQDAITLLDLSAASPRQMLNITLNTSGSELLFSPSGAYFMWEAGTSTGNVAIHIYRVAGVSTAVLVHSGEMLPSGIAGEGVRVAASGFNRNAAGAAETAFMYAWVTGQNTFNWNVVDLTQGKQVISQSSTAQAVLWQFNSCGNILAFINQPFGNEEQVDLFSTEKGTHIGEASFPVQDVVLSSTPDQEVAKISSPQQTIVIANDPSCDPNTPPGSNVSVAPVAASSNTSPATVTFTNVTQAGGTGVTSSSTGTAPPAGFQIGDPPVFYDISTSASYSGTIVVCFDYSGITFNGPPRLFHFVNGAWVDVTTSVDTTTHTICGEVTSLSPFAIFASANHPPSAQSGPPQVVEATSVAGALVTLAGSASDPDSDPLTLTWSENGITRGTGAQISVTLPIGTHTITLTADDDRGGTGTSTTTVTVQDTTPPVFTPPANQTLEATSSAGASAVFTAAAADTVDGERPVLCSPTSGSTFPRGATTVNCTATDLHGNTSSGSFTITVRDTRPPVVTPPTSITVAATEAGGVRGSASVALAAFLAGGSASDIVDPAPTRLTPQIGGVNADNNTLFPVGTTTVSFRFRDAGGNVGTATASVTVILGTIKIVAQVTAHGKNADGTSFVDVKLTNAGTGNARNLRIDLLPVVATKGNGRITIVAPVFPTVVGNLDAGASQTMHIVLKVPATVKQLVLAEVGDFSNVKGTRGLFAQEQTLSF